MLIGGCLCGAVRYRADAAPLYEPTLCHCRSCQRAAGAHAVAWCTVSLAALRFERGEPVSFGSSPGVRRTFCGRCGTPLTYWNEKRGDEIDITVCSLDDPGRFAPADHIWTADAVSWEPLLPSRPRFRLTRGS